MIAVDADLEYAKTNWKVFTPNLMYPISSKPDLILKHYEKCSYVYSFYRVDTPNETLLDVNSLYFKIYKMNTLKLPVIVGFTIIPTLPTDYFIRYTPYSIVASRKGVTEKDIKNSERKVIFSHECFEIVYYSCGVEIISDLWSRMGVSPEGD